ncbi:efflux transporter outer membrane subunit [Methylocystis echinoides]|uniref:RND transporter n=1 Tax=Methylocystis echinoides TaxID=29468 RepID=A0A9W6LSK9_9HYPH|nr:efflux transporter outer membrane subunit [Methylocystis echinoides]GLI93561.1 RND transporter [Methylocystis echinoides]
MQAWASTAICLAASGLASCNLDWEKPELSTVPPERFLEARPKSALPIPAGSDFARKFGSKELAELTARALDDNLAIAGAMARIDQADARARIASSALWPSVGLGAAALRAQTPGTVLSETPNYNPSQAILQGAGQQKAAELAENLASFSAVRNNFFALGLNASYEIDFWGKNQDASNAARLLANASRFDRDVIEIATMAAVMNAYFLVLAAQDQLRIAHEHVRIAEQVLGAFTARLEKGAATMLDYGQQAAVLAGQKATIPPLEQTLRQTKVALAVLLGQTPETLEIKGGSMKALRYPRLDPGLPSEVLLRRPDVAEAEARLASQEFSVLRARAAFFPSVTLNGQYGLQSIVLRNLLRPEAIAWELGSNLAQPLFDGFALQGQYELEKARFAEAAAFYKQRILSAIGDTESALIAEKETAKSVKIGEEAVAASKIALDAARAQLLEGKIDVITLSTVQTTYFQYDFSLTQARLAHLNAAVSLYQALGGGWSPTTRNAEIARANAAYEANKGPWP